MESSLFALATVCVAEHRPVWLFSVFGVMCGTVVAGLSGERTFRNKLAGSLIYSGQMGYLSAFRLSPVFATAVREFGNVLFCSAVVANLVAPFGLVRSGLLARSVASGVRTVGCRLLWEKTGVE